MTAEGLRDQLAEAADAELARGTAWYIPTGATIADALLPVVEAAIRRGRAQALRDATKTVQAVYDMQCPVMPADHYVGAGARIAHLWWQKVLGGTLDDLRDRADAEEFHRVELQPWRGARGERDWPTQLIADPGLAFQVPSFDGRSA